MTDRQNSFIMLLLLSILIFVYNFATGIYYASGLEPLPAVEFLYTAAFVCGVVWWLKAEAGSMIEPIYCSGLVVGYGWLILVPYCLFKKRGVRAFIPLLALLGSFIAGQVSAAILYLMLAHE